MASLCNGRCCKEFFLNIDIEEDYVKDMVISVEGQENIYDCKYWDKETTLCTAYETRPDICKNFPYTYTPSVKACELCGETNAELQRELT